jgi:hypothetical protein
MTADEYRETAAQLARDAVMPADAAANLEARLQQAFAERMAAAHVPSRSRRWGWAAAAVVVIGAAAAAWYGHQAAMRANRTMVTANRETDSQKPDERARLKAGATEIKAGLKAGTTEIKAGLKAGTTEIKAGLKAGATERLPAAEFVAVPAAASLPQFESGVIFRISLPVTALPSYGVDISPASGDEPVEADVLVGQDGHPRAIRLVSNSSRSGK